MSTLDIALCYESVLPARGGAETYIGDLARRLAQDGHTVHLYACRWDANSLPSTTQFHQLTVPSGPRFLRPWRFATACEQALAQRQHDVTVGFDKTWGQDVLYPQGGLHAASRYHNQLKFAGPVSRFFGSLGKFVDPASWSFARLERKQYFGTDQPTVIVNSQMVRRHFQQFYGRNPASLQVVHSAIDPGRFASDDRFKRRQHERESWGVSAEEPVGLFVAMNYRLKGLAPLLHGVAAVPREQKFRIAIVGHPKFKKYERLAAQLGIQDRVLFLGFRADPKDSYFAADFLVHPTFYDPCSLVALEALACGLPVITSRYNGASELLTVPDNGIVIQDPHNAQELGAAITQMIAPEYRRTATASARQAANNWTFEKHYEALVTVFRQIQSKKMAA